MPSAAVGPVIAGAAGLLGAGGAAATGAGKSRFAAQRYGESPDYNPEKFEYGGHYGGADNAANAAGSHMNEWNGASEGYRDQGVQFKNIAEQDREAGLGAGANISIDRDHANQEANLALQSRGDAMGARNLSLLSRMNQQQGLNMMMSRAQGNNLIADREANGARRNLALQMQSAAASARGPAALANAQQDSMAAQAQGLSGINYNATTAAQQEQQANEQAAFGAASGMRTGDSNLQNMDINQQGQDSAARNLGIQQQGADVNAMNGYVGQENADLTGMGQSINAMNNTGNLGLGYGNLQNNIEGKQTDANTYQQGLMANSFNNKQTLDSGNASNNAQQDLGYIKMGTAAVAGAAGAGMPPAGPSPAPMPKAGGGPVRGGPEYLVGEQGPEAAVDKRGDISVVGQQGPEVVQFGKDATIVPAQQTAETLALYEPPGKRLQQSEAGHGYLADEQTEDTSRPSLSGAYSGPGAPKSRALEPKVAQVAQSSRRKPTPDELMAMADALHAQMKVDHASLMAQGPAVQARCGGGEVYAREEGGPVYAAPAAVAPSPNPLPDPPKPQAPKGNTTEAVGIDFQRPYVDHRTMGRSSPAHRQRQGALEIDQTPEEIHWDQSAPQMPNSLPPPFPPPVDEVRPPRDRSEREVESFAKKEAPPAHHEAIAEAIALLAQKLRGKR